MLIARYGRMYIPDLPPFLHSFLRKRKYSGAEYSGPCLANGRHDIRWTVTPEYCSPIKATWFAKWRVLWSVGAYPSSRSSFRSEVELVDCLLDFLRLILQLWWLMNWRGLTKQKLQAEEKNRNLKYRQIFGCEMYCWPFFNFIFSPFYTFWTFYCCIAFKKNFQE